MIEDITSKDFIKKVTEEANERIKKATALMMLKNTEGWAILLNTFENMKVDHLKILEDTNPGDKEAVLAAHMVWYTVVHTLDEVVRALDGAINQGIEAKQELDNLNQVPPDEDWS